MRVAGIALLGRLVDGMVDLRLFGRKGDAAFLVEDANALEAGLAANIVRSGTSGGVMRIGPPLTVKDEEIDYGLELLDGAIKSVVEH